jgi:uncharacterized protein with von Willebrand factor type A (vWA) domain
MTKDWLHTGLLFTFFKELRICLPLELDMQQYELLLSSLRAGVGTDGDGRYSRASFLNLCKTLWLPHPEYEQRFESVFEYMIQQTGEVWIMDEEGSNSGPSEPLKPPQRQRKATSPDRAEVGPKPKDKEEQPSPVQEKKATGPEAIDYKDWEVAFDISLEETGGLSSSIASSTEHSFIYTDHHFSAKVRYMQQQCRHLRYRAEKRAGKQIDLLRTIQASAQYAGFPSFCYTSDYFYAEHFVVFIDRGIGMSAFDKLADAFADALRSGLGISASSSSFQTFYFDETPGRLFYKDARLRISFEWEKLQRQLSADDFVFIISDAGATRRRNDMERYGQLAGWVQSLQQQTRHLLWLNPTPRYRWRNTPAAYLPLLTTALPLTTEGLLRLPSVLKHL